MELTATFNRNGTLVYSGDGYTFKFKNPDLLCYETLIIKPSHLYLITNDLKMSNQKVKEKAVNDFFQDENDDRKANVRANKKSNKST